jgi:hypothetical protein
MIKWRCAETGKICLITTESAKNNEYNLDYFGKSKGSQNTEQRLEEFQRSAPEQDVGSIFCIVHLCVELNFKVRQIFLHFYNKNFLS